MYFREAAENEGTSTTYVIGLLNYYAGGAEQDYREAISWFKKAADDNSDIDTLNYIRVIYKERFSTKKNYNLAS
jgi:TPR repeat protein